MKQLNKLKKRAQFLHVRDYGVTWVSPYFFLKACRRAYAGPWRLGFIVTKKLGGSVVRNRIRRRLRALVDCCLTSKVVACDYVITAKSSTWDATWDDLKSHMKKAMAGITRKLATSIKR